MTIGPDDQPGFAKSGSGAVGLEALDSLIPACSDIGETSNNNSCSVSHSPISPGTTWREPLSLLITRDAAGSGSLRRRPIGDGPR
jgi:hypothetical protein